MNGEEKYKQHLNELDDKRFVKQTIKNQANSRQNTGKIDDYYKDETHYLIIAVKEQK